MFLHRKKYFVLISSLCVLIAVAVAFTYLLLPAKASMNIDVSGGSVRIIIGSADETVSRAYSSTRQAFLAELAQEESSENFSAVAVMNDYYTVDQVSQIISEYGLEVQRVYMWEPSESGKLVLSIENNDIASAITAFLARMSTRYCSEAEQNDLEKLANGVFGIYALTISGSAQELQELSENVPEFVSVDVKYNPEAETYATTRGMPYSYVELPSKPDGAH